MLRSMIALMLTACVLGAPPAAGADELDDLFPKEDAERQASEEDSGETAPPQPGEDQPPGASSGPATERAEPLATIAVGTRQKDPVEPRPVRSRLMEEIVVTAQKREQLVTDVPISVAAFSGQALDARGVGDPKDLQLITPGLQYGSISQYSVIFLRGVGTDAFIPSADMSVATYIDGIYFPFSHGLAQSFGAVERVEVLKGPQGTLFGRNSTGGAISVVTKEPGEVLEASTQLVLGNFDTTQLRAHAGGPLGDTFSVSLAGLYNRWDEYYRYNDESVVQEFFNEQSFERGARLKLRWRPLDAIELKLNGVHLEAEGPGTMILTMEKVSPLGRLLGIEAQPDYELQHNDPTFFFMDSDVAYMEARWQPAWLDTKLLASHQDVKTTSGLDFDGSNTPAVAYDAHNQFARVSTGELQFLSNDGSWRSDEFEWIVGGYYIKSLVGLDPLLFRIATIPGFVLPTGQEYEIIGVLDTISYAAFFQGTYDVLAWLGLTLGARYQYEERELVKSRVSTVANDGGRIVIQEHDLPPADFTNVSPKVGLNLRPSDDMLVFLSWAKGFKSGTFNLINLTGPPEFVLPEEVESVELGVKATLLDGRMQVNAAVFRNTIENLQAQVVSLQSSGAIQLENAGRASSQGGDLDVTWQFLPGWVLTSGVSVLDSVYDSYPNGSGYDQETGQFRDHELDFSGNTMVRAPKLTVNTGLGYTRNFLRGTLEIAGDVYYNDGFFFDAQNVTVEEPYEVFNARISYLYEPWNLRATVFGKNLDEARYHYNLQQTDFGTTAGLAPPAQYGLRLNYDF